jgi:hypothetical protein
MLNDITMSRKFRGGSPLKLKPIPRLVIKSIPLIETGGRSALASQFSKPYCH